MLSALKQLLPTATRRWLRRKSQNVQRGLLPLDRLTDFARLRRVTPYRRDFGWHRGQCVDRVYIEQFLGRHSGDIRGRAVEIGENLYMAKFGGAQITRAEVLDCVARPEVTLLADLSDAPSIPDHSFDCILCTQTLMYLYDPAAAVRTMHRTLVAGGVALVTLAGISQIAPKRMTGGAEDYWRFTPASAQRLFAEVFGAENVTAESYGNVLTATALLHGLVAEELTSEEFAARDADYPVIVAVRAVKAPDDSASAHD